MLAAIHRLFKVGWLAAYFSKCQFHLVPQDGKASPVFVK
jgi:hypothetical protein